MTETEKCKDIAEVFTQLSDKNKTRLSDIALGMQLQRQIDTEAEEKKELELQNA